MALHDTLHGFIEGRGTGTSILEAKLVHQLAGITNKPLFQVFLYVQKACNYLYRGRCMEIIRGYGMVQNIAHLIDHHWYSLLFVPNSRRFLGMTFGTGRGVTQVDPASPMIFNIVVDAVVILV